MGLLANYPIAVAPGMGHNVYFTYVVALSTLGYTWQQALGATFLSSLLFLLLSLFGLRAKLVTTLPVGLRNAIAVGIGLLISMVGLQWSGIVVDSPSTLVSLGDVTALPVLVSFLGLGVTAVLLVRGFASAILMGMLVCLLTGLATGIIRYQGILGPLPSLYPTFLQLDITGALEGGFLSIIFVFFFLDLFDTVGTLTGVCQQAGFIQADGSLPRARRAFLADALASLTGSLLGTSTVTSYIESAAGVGVGARTGLANLFTGSLFLLAVFFSPLVGMIGAGVPHNGSHLYPVVAPALMIVGCLMLKNVSRIDWSDYSQSIPAFLTIVIMPMTFSITEGIAFGFISYTLLQSVLGRFRKVPFLIRLFTLLFVLRYLFLMP